MRQRGNILGVAIDAVGFEEALDRVEDLIRSGGSHYVCVNSTQDIMISQDDETFRQIVNNADLATPDGWPVVWGLRANGLVQKGRVTGPDIMLAMCERSVRKGYKHYLYGGAEGVPELLETKLVERYPGLQIVGRYSPPFRPLTPEEDQAAIDTINASGADMLWVGLGTPKQHFWIKDHLGKVKVPVLLGVGAAFDFHSGRIQRAPKWMQDSGLEWVDRIFKEPKRLGKRYLKYLPAFAWKFSGQLLGIGRYSID